MTKPKKTEVSPREFDDREFYELMQAYRHVPVERFVDVRNAYDKVRDYVREVTASQPSELERLRIAVEALVAITHLGGHAGVITPAIAEYLNKRIGRDAPIIAHEALKAIGPLDEKESSK